MLDFLKSSTHKELEKIMTRLELNMSNNYKDAAQDDMAELEKRFNELIDAKKLNSKQQARYAENLKVYKEKYQNYTHKAQKTRW